MSLSSPLKLNAKKKEVVDTEALLERYRQEIEELKKRLEEREREAEAPRKRRLSAREVCNHSSYLIHLNLIRITAIGRV